MLAYVTAGSVSLRYWPTEELLLHATVSFSDNPSLLTQASSGVPQPLHLQLRLKQQQLRLVTVTGAGRKNLMFDYEGISGSAVIGA